MKRWPAYLSMLALTLISVVCRAEQTTVVYDTYLAAEKLVPALETYLQPSDKITAYKTKLFVKASPLTQDQIYSALQEIDRLPQNIQVSLRFTDQRFSEQPSKPDQVRVYRGSSQSSEIKTEVVNRTTLSTDDHAADQQIRVLEGETGQFTVTNAELKNTFFFISPTVLATGQTQQNLGHQFYVVPTRVGEKIRLQIYTAHKRDGQNGKMTVDTTTATTVLVVEPGVWTPLAASGQANTNTDKQNVYSTRSQSTQNKSIQIKAITLD